MPPPPVRYERLPFVRTPYTPDLRFADLIRAQGQDAADAERRRGDISAQLWGNLANIVGRIPQQMQEAKSQQQQTEVNALKLNEARRGEQTRQTFDTAMKAGSRDRVLQSLEGQPELYEKAQQHFSAIDDNLKRTWGSVAAGVRAFGDTPEAAMAALDDLTEQGFDDRRLAQYRAAIQQNPASVSRLVDELLKQSPDPTHRALLPKTQEPFTLNEGDVRFAPDGTQIAAVPAKPPTPTQASLAAAAAAGNPQAQAALDKLNPTPEPKKYSVTVAGSNGEPITKLVTEQEMAQGVRAYREPKSGSQERFWVVRNGQPVRITDAEYRQGDLPSNTREQGRPVTSGDANRVADFDTSLDDVAVLRGTVTGNKATGTIAKLGAMAPNWWTELTGWGTDAKSKQAVIDRVKQVIGKALEGGVLRKEDEVKYEKILPTIADVSKVVTDKLAGLETAITQRRQTLLDALSDANYDTAKFTARPPRTPGGAVTVKTPDGQIFTFPSKEAAEGFKQRAGIK